MVDFYVDNFGRSEAMLVVVKVEGLDKLGLAVKTFCNENELKDFFELWSGLSKSKSRIRLEIALFVFNIGSVMLS